MKPAHMVTPRSRKAIIVTVAGANTSEFVKIKYSTTVKVFVKYVLSLKTQYRRDPRELKLP